MTTYVKQTWQDNNHSLPVSAARMGHIEDGIDAATVFINVRAAAYGATGDGVTDDRAAVQAAIDAVAASTYGGIVFFPPGDYLIGAPGLVTATSQQTPIVLQGSGYATNAVGTRLLRNGAYTLFSAAGTGTSSSTMVNDLWVRDITFAGAAQAATLVRLDRGAGCLFQNVRFQNSTRRAFHGSQIWNTRFLACVFETSGDAGTSTPSVTLDGYAGVGTTNTVHFEACHWEGNLFHDLELDGADTSSRCTGVNVMNSKWEGDTAGSHVHFKKAQYCNIVGGLSNSNGGSTSPNITHTEGVLNNVSNLSLIGTSNTYLFQGVGGQQVTITGCGLIGGSSAHIRLNSGFLQAQIVGNSHYTLTSEANVSDARTVKTGTVDLTYVPQARVYHNANQSITAGATTVLAFNSELYDTEAIHDTAANNSRLTCVTPGKYGIRAVAEFANATDATRRLVDILLNGATIIARVSFAALNGANTAVPVSCDYDLVAGDYVEVRVLQDSIGAINVVAGGTYTPQFSMARIGA